MKILYTIFILVLMAAPAGAQQGAVEDTLVVAGRAVVFFGPSDTEYMAMTDDEKNAIDEELYDFLHYRIKALPFLESNDIQEFLTALPKIQIQLTGAQTTTYTRREFDHFVGLIMTDGLKEPEVFLGAATKSELIRLFEAYFGLQ
jgi:hypothetical protein